MVVDLNKCTGCKVCEGACRNENNVPYYGNSTDEKRYNAYWLRVADVTPDPEIYGEGGKTRHIPLMCQHCDDPPCVHVCVTKASTVREDGIVVIDEHRCIGCRYCIIACPYRARSMIFKENDKWTNKEVPKMMIGVATKCTFCTHRVDKAVGEGKNPMPACVEACPHDALIFGNMNDPKSEVAKIIGEGKVQVLRPNLEVGPGVFYDGL
jgi:molybdopterin-containing oxidoreductase family iron-sulfur binding subunit